MAGSFDNPFAPDDNAVSAAFGSFGQAVPRQTVTPGGDSVLDALDSIGRTQEPVVTPEPVDVQDEITPVPSNLLNAPTGGREGTEKEPTAFQQKKVKWSDGGRDERLPKPYEEIGTDFLEVDYEFGKKDGATDKPVRAANVFGRQFTAEELTRDEEGRKLLDLMTQRRLGTYNEGGALANFAKGWGNWSKSDIPFYGWMSDMGASISEAIDMSRTIRKLQDGQTVTPHEALAVRRFMLQQEMESTRTMAYNVGSVVRQAVPFMAEMAATSAIGAAVGSVIPGLGTGIGAAGGAIVGGLKWLFTGGKAAAKAGTRMAIEAGTKAIAQKVAKGAAIDVAERGVLRAASRQLLGREAMTAIRREAAEELGEGATRAALRDVMTRKTAERLASADVIRVGDRIAKTMLVEGDVYNSVAAGVGESFSKFALQFVKAKPAQGASQRAIEKAVREGVREGVRKYGSVDAFREAFLKDVGGGFTKGFTQTVTESMGKVTGSAIENRYAETVTRAIVNDAMRNFELKFAGSGFLSTPERFMRFASHNIARGLLQSEHAFFAGGAPTIAHAGFGTFHSGSAALMEGIGRTFIQAPIQAGIQLGVQSPLYAGVALANDGDFYVRGQLGNQIQALVTGDRESMDRAQRVAIGQMFAEYWSEGVGRGLVPMLGGAAAKAAGRSPTQLAKAVLAARDSYITPLTRQTGDYLSKAVEAVFGKVATSKEGLATAVKYGERYVSDLAVKGASKSDVARIVTSKTLDGISAEFREALESKGIRSARDFIEKSLRHAGDATKLEVARDYIGYYLMQKGLTPQAVVKAFRQMGKGGGVLEEMGEERFGDFVKGLFHWDDTASDAGLFSEDRMRSMFGGFTDGEQLATEFLGFAFPGAVRSGTLRTMAWLGQGGMRKNAEDASTVVRILEAARSTDKPVVQIEGNTAADAVASAVRSVPLAGVNQSATAEQEENAGASGSGIALVNTHAREDMADALDGIAVNLGRVDADITASMSWGRRALTRVVGLPAALVTGDFSFVAQNPALWAAMDAGVPLAMQTAARKAYHESLVHGFRAIENELDADVRERFQKALDAGGHFATSLRDLNLDRATLARMEEAGAGYRRALLDSVAQEYLSASGVLAVAQSDLDEPALRIVLNTPEYKGTDVSTPERKADFIANHRQDIDRAKQSIVDGVLRVAQDENAMHYTTHGQTGRNSFMMSLDCLRAVQNGTQEEVLAAILNLPAFRGVHGIINISDNAEHSMESIQAMARTVDADRIADMAPADENGDFTPEQLAEILHAMGARADLRSEAANQAAAKTFVSQIRLMREGSLSTYQDKRNGGRTASVLPVLEGNARRWIVRVTDEAGQVTETPVDSFESANEMLAADGFVADHKQIVITSSREVTSSDATSMVYFMHGNDRQSIREAYLRELGGDEAVTRDRDGLRPETVNETDLPPFVRKTYAQNEGVYRESGWGYSDDRVEEAAAKFREEKAENGAGYQRYEQTGDSILAAMGVIRHSTDGTVASGLGANAYVARVDGGFNRNALILAPDFASDGDSEAMLRASLKLALNTSVSSADADAAGRCRLFADSYKEFLKARDAVLARLRETDTRAYETTKSVLAKMFPVRTGKVTTDDLAVIAAASVFFTSDRGVMQYGNGYFGAAELAAVADEFRASDIFPLFVSAIDEALGGNGLFTRAAGSTTGLSRYLAAFSADRSALSAARESSLFLPENSRGGKKANPYAVSYSYEGGVCRAAKDTETGKAPRAQAFDGDVPAYIASIAAGCHSIANGFGDEDGLPQDGGYSSAQMYERMKRAGMFAGDTAGMDAPSLQASGGDLITTEAGRREIAKGVKMQDSPTMTSEDARRIGMSLRTVYRAAGLDLATGYDRVREFLADRNVPADSVAEILAGYESTAADTDEIPDVRPSEAEAREDDLVESRDADGTDKYEHESAIRQFDSNADVRAVSNVCKWFYNLEGGDVSAIFVRVRDTLRRIPEGLVPRADVKDIRRFAELMDPFAAPERTVAQLAKNWELRTGDRAAMDAMLDRVIGALGREGMLDTAVAVAAIRRLPHNRRLKVLAMMSQLTPTGYIEIVRDDSFDHSFHLRTRGSVNDVPRAMNAFQTMYTSLLSSPIFRTAVTASDFAGRMAAVETFCQSFDSRGVPSVRALNAAAQALPDVDVAGVADAIAACRALSPSQSVDRQGFRIFAVEKSDFDALCLPLPETGVTDPQFDPRAKLPAVRKALDSIQALTLKRMEALAKASDLLFGHGSDASVLLRSRDTVATIRNQLERSVIAYLRYGEDGRRQGKLLKRVNHDLRMFLDFANSFAADDRSGWKATSSGARQLRPISKFLFDTLYDPVAGLGRRLTGDSAAAAISSQKAADYAKAMAEAASRKGWKVQDEDHYRREYARTAHQMRGVSSAAARAEAYAKALDANPHAQIRSLLAGMASDKFLTGQTLADGISATDARLGFTTGFDPNQERVPDTMKVTIDAYMSSMPRNSQRIGGRAGNAIEGSENRTITTLPSQVPAFLRACNSQLFRLAGLEVLKANGLRWADGSNPVVAVLGATDNGNLIDRMHLAGLANATIVEDVARNGNVSNLVIPLFRGDKSSMYALSVPVSVTREWLNALFKDPNAVRMPKAVRERFDLLVSRMRERKTGLDALLSAKPANPNASYDRAISEKWEDLSADEKLMRIRADYYSTVYGLVASACGQDKIDAKRVAVNLSIGPIIPMFDDTGREAEGGPKAGYYRTTVVGGASGGAMMGGWFVHGSMADAVSAMSDNGKAEAIKVHVYGLNDGVDFDKGQAHDYGIFDDDEETTDLACVSWWRARMRERICLALGMKATDLELPKLAKVPELTGDSTEADEAARREAVESNAALMEAYLGNKAKAVEFLKHSTFAVDDLETHKAGAFGSCAGVRVADGAKEIRLGKNVLFVKDGKDWVPSDEVAAKAPWFVLRPEVKNGCAPIAAVLSAYAIVNGDLEADAVAELVPSFVDAQGEEQKGAWVLPDGSESSAKLANSGLLPSGSTLGFRVMEGSGVAMDFFTRSMIAQVVANNSASSVAKDGHTFATNLTRDVQVDELLTQAIAEVADRTTSFVDAHTTYALLQLAQLQQNPQALWDVLNKDAEFAAQVSKFPDDRQLRDAAFDKLKAYVAKQMIPSYHGNHGVMVASGLKASCDRWGHTAEIEEAPGMDAVTRDRFRPARPYGTAEKTALQSLTGTRISRSYASGTVNVRQEGFRYGWYVNDDALEAMLGNEEISSVFDSHADELQVLLGAYDEATARAMVAIRSAIEFCRDREFDRESKAFRAVSAAFSDYFSSRVRLEGVRFDDLFLDGSFDYAAIDVRRRAGRDGADHIFLGGSFFAAHRSPSGNIEAFCGLARATSPVTWNRRTGEPGAESKYALDPVTTNTQGSDTDGDSAGIQVYDYTVPDRYDRAAVSEFIDHFASVEYTGFAERAKEIMDWARAHGWTLAEDANVVDPDFLRAIERELFAAQVRNYRNSPTFHQGYVPRSLEGVKSREGAAPDIIDASAMVDAGIEVYDTGFAGRAPVGTDAVWDEPVSAGDYAKIEAYVGKGIMPAWKEGITCLDLLNKAVGSAKIDLVDPFSAANLSNAASDSADARGVSVFLQSRFVRALSEGIRGINAPGANITGTFPPVRPDGYSPVIDLTSHFDGISNNLFDTLKKMFATRAGWTKDLLPILMARIVRHAVDRGPSVRLDNRFFVAELLRFLAERRREGSPIWRYLRYTDPIEGTQNLVEDLNRFVTANPLATDAQLKGWYATLRTTDSSVTPKMRQEALRRINIAEFRRTIGQRLAGLRPDTTALDIVKALSSRDVVSPGEEMYWAAWSLGRLVEGRTDMTEDEAAFERDLHNSSMAYVRSIGDITDFPKFAGRTFARISRMNRKFGQVEIGRNRSRNLLAALKTDSPSSVKQAAVNRLFADWTARTSENAEVIVGNLATAANRFRGEDARALTQAEVNDNYERMLHAFGAFGFLRALDRDRDWEARIREFGKDTRDFVRNVASAVSLESNRALAMSTGERDLDPVSRLFAATVVDGVQFRLASRASSGDIDALRQGFDALLGSTERYRVNGVEVEGRELARLMVLHASITTTYGARTSYVTQSSFPAVFGDARIADFDRFRGTVEAVENADLLSTDPVRFEGSDRTRAYDLLSAFNLRKIETLWKTRKFVRAAEDPFRTFVKDPAKAPSTDITDIGFTDDAIDDLDIPPMASDVLCRPLLRAHRMKGVFGQFPRLETDVAPETAIARNFFGGGEVSYRIDPSVAFDSLEEALNDWMSTAAADAVRHPDLMDQAERYHAASGKYWFETGLSSKDHSLGLAAREILGYAVRRSPELYAAIRDAEGVILTGNDLVDAAYASVKRQIENGRIADPAVGAEPQLQATMKGGASRPVIGTGPVIRANFFRTVRDEQARKSVPDAIRSAFARVFGENKVTVEPVGEDSNLLKVVRRIGHNRKITTYIAYGEHVMPQAPLATILGNINVEREKLGLEPIAREIVDAMPESDRWTFLTAAAHGMKVAGASYAINGFAGAMSGLIRLGDDAGYQTLFHEYFHQMKAVYSKLGVITDEESREIDEEFGGEEGAADAYSRYLTQIDRLGGDDQRLRDYYEADGTVSRRALDLFARFRTAAEALALATCRGTTADGLPVFVRCVLMDDLADRDMSAWKRPTKAQVRRVEEDLLGKPAYDDADPAGPLTTPEQEKALADLYLVIWGRRDGDLKAGIEATKKALSKPVEAKAQVEATKPAPKPNPLAGLSPVGKVQSFLKAALSHYGESAGSYPELASDLADVANAEYLHDPVGESVTAQRVVFGVRRLVREVAASLGIAVEEMKDGKVSLTEAGRLVLDDRTVTELALRLMHEADSERKTQASYALGAKNASADYAFGRSLQRVSPGSYAAFSIDRARAASRLFAQAERQALDAAEAASSDADRVKWERQAQELGSLAQRVVEYAMHIANGDDIHYLFPKNQNSGNLHGLLFKVFSGGASFADVGSADGIRRYAADGRFDYSFDLNDPLVQAAYDLANQAFFTAEAARSVKAETPADADVARLVADALDGQEPKVADRKASEPGFARIDLGTNATHWILSSPGNWILSDMQKDFMAVGLREMMTDHTTKAATETAYNFATTALQFFGMDCYAGDRLRAMEIAESHLGRNAKGDMAYVYEGGKSIMRFSHTTGYLFGAVNFGAKRTGEPLTAEDLQLMQFALQAVAAKVSCDSHLVTGIGIGYVSNRTDSFRLQQKDAMTNYSPARVMDRILGVARDSFGRKVNPTPVDKMLYRLMLSVPRDILGDTNVSVRDPRTGSQVWANRVGNGMYGQLVGALISGARKASRERTESDRKDRFLEEIIGRGIAVRATGGRVNLAVPVSDVYGAWDATGESGMKAKLAAAGRPAEMLDLAYWENGFARETRKLNLVAAKSSYLRNGVGTSLTLAGTPAFWFHGGSGAHMLDVQKYRTALDALRDATPSSEADIRESHLGLVETLEMVGAKSLKEPAFAEGGVPLVSDAQLLYLADLIGLKSEEGFSIERFVNEIVRGEYAGGARVPGVDLGPQSTKFDIALAINRLVTEKIVDELGRTDLEKARKSELLAVRTINERIADRLQREMPGQILAESDMQVFAKTGDVGTNWTACDRLLQMTKEIVAAERFRGCLAQMMTSVAADGTPNYVPDPDDNAAAVGRMPDAYWGALARFSIARLRGVEGMPAYDAGRTGVENMQAVAKAVRAAQKGKGYREIEGNPCRGLFRGILCRATDTDVAGNVSDLSLTQGGEAMAYMKQLLGTLEKPHVGTALRQIERLMAWTKLASVGFSSFFQIATAFESQTAASGFTQAFLGNIPGKAGAKLGRAIGRALGREGGLGGFQADALSFKDIIENINSNDPFIVEARELCDLIGMPLDQSVDPYQANNEANPALGQGGTVKQDIEAVYRMAQRFNVKGAGMLKSFLNFCYQHPTDYTFNVVLNGVKLAVVAQTMRRLREECLAGDRPFDPIRELRRHAAYMNAEIGGIDPARYAWATPQMQRILRLGMFSWQWTVGAWVAGTGEVLSDAIFGGHSTTRASRQYALIRWMRMLGIVKFGVPLVLQVAVKTLSKAMACMLPPPDDEQEADDQYDERKVPWMMWNNESKAGSLSFDVTPLLKLARRIPGVAALKEANVPVISALVPAYVGGGRNTTGKRRYYMHFGKQSDEFWRWFTDAPSQLMSKTSIPGQKLLEGIFGKASTTGYSKPFAELDFLERWFNTNFSADDNAFVNLGQMFLPFSWQGAKQNADAGFLAAVGPMKMGQSKRSTRLRIVERVNEFVEDARTNDPWSYPRNRRKLNLLCTDILREAQLNGIQPADIMTSALGDVAHVQYLKLMGALPKDANSNKVDTKEAMKAIRALVRINRKAKDVMQAIVSKYEAAGTDVKRNRAFYEATVDLLRTTYSAPFADDEAMKARFDRWYEAGTERYMRSTKQTAKAGEAFANFLATDEVPETLFGVPIVTSGYTEEDLAFFREHPEAGGFYDMGDEETEGGEQ